MEAKIIVSTTTDETRMGLVENNRLAEYIVERNSTDHLVGNIIKGQIKNIVRGIQAAFIDIGSEQNAFLYIKEDNLTEGKTVLVQIVKDARSTKGPTASRDISLPGRYVVLLPMAKYVGVSHKIADKEERERLKKIVEENRQDELGFVVRTAAVGIAESEIILDIKRLCESWRVIKLRAKVEKAPATLYRELDLSIRIVRDYLTEHVKEIILDNKTIYYRVCEHLAMLNIDENRCKVTLYERQDDIFSYYGLNSDIAAISDRKIELPCGGYLIIDNTEAMTVIDVNSGRYSSNNNLTETIMKTNKEAAAEIAHQLRLRDIGGIIIVDFIDMHLPEQQEEVLKILDLALNNDKMKPKVQDITVLNLVEITRKKARKNISAVLYSPCPICNGSGRVQSRETMVLEIKRRLRTMLKKSCSTKSILILTSPWLKEWFTTGEIKYWEKELSCKLKVEGDANMHPEAFTILDNTGLDK